MSFSQDHQALSYTRKLTKASCCVSETTSRAKVTSALFTKAQMAAAFSQQFQLISPVFCSLIALKLMYPQEGIVSGVKKLVLPPVSCVSSKMLKPLQALASVCKTGMAVPLRGKWNEAGKRNCGCPRAPGLSGCPSGSRPGHNPLLQHVHQGPCLVQGLGQRGVRGGVCQPQRSVCGLTHAMQTGGCGNPEGVPTSSEEGMLEQALEDK